MSTRRIQVQKRKQRGRLKPAPIAPLPRRKHGKVRRSTDEILAKIDEVLS